MPASPAYPLHLAIAITPRHEWPSDCDRLAYIQRAQRYLTRKGALDIENLTLAAAVDWSVTIHDWRRGRRSRQLIESILQCPGYRISWEELRAVSFSAPNEMRAAAAPLLARGIVRLVGESGLELTAEGLELTAGGAQPGVDLRLS